MEEKKNLESFEIVEEETEKEPQEIITIYRDIDDLGRTFVTKEVLEKFHITIPAYKIELDDGTEIYEISPTVAIYIIDHSNNTFAPYTIQYQGFDFENELEDEKEGTENNELEEIQIFRDIDDSGRAFVTEDVLKRFHITNPRLKVFLSSMVVYEIDTAQAINIINNCDNAYAPYKIRYVSIQFGKEPEKKEVPEEPIKKEVQEEREYIPGTDYRKPRVRKPHESDDHYVAYLEGYYDSIFHHEEIATDYYDVKLASERKRPRERGVYETDEDYVRYLRDFYNRIIKPEVQERLNSKKILKQRDRRPDETDEDYIRYLSMFYGTPEVPKEEVHHTK